MFCGGPQTMRAKTAQVVDSAEAGHQPGTRHHHWRRGTRSHRHWGRPGGGNSLTLGNIIHFAIAAFLLWPIFVVVAVIWSLGDTINFIRHSVEACISSTFWLGRLCKEQMGGMYLHRNSPGMQRLIGQRKAFGAEAAKDWREAGRAAMNIGRAWSRTFGLGGLFNDLEQRIQHANQDWRRYVATQAYDNSQAPAEFPEQYVVVDELPRGGSSARLYVVRKADEPQGRLHVLKYFDLRAGGNLESVVRESQAAQLAQKLGLIVESKLGENAFWYVMPYYSGETLTAGVMRNIKYARSQGTLNEHHRITLGYVHQLLQIIAQYHEAGVFHKDIKPDNLIINGEKIYLVDIGLMTPLSSMAQLTTHGTEYFRDPEMVKLALEGREVRQVDAAKFDVYSIGAVLFFALSGEFPTSGALSRLPREVPAAAQWIVNRAMTGMHQRYANARSMLTDVDYLTWAASQGKLADVKPADLPSFRGMPVPPHLQSETPPNNTEWREKLSAAPGGYGAWYAAPAYAPPKREFTFKKALAIAFVLTCVLGTMFAGVSALWLTAARVEKASSNSPERSVTRSDTGLHTRLPDDRLKPVFFDIDESLAEGVQISRSEAPRGRRLSLALSALTELHPPARGWEKDLAQRVWRAARRTRQGIPKAEERRFVFLATETDPSQTELAGAIEFELASQAPRQGMPAVHWDQARLERTRQLLISVGDEIALHRELAIQCAEANEQPPIFVAVSIDESGADRQLKLRAIFPGREHHVLLPFTDSGE